MSDKDRRQRAIADLIRGAALANQEELGERLTGLGYAVTQATISRDLEQLGAMKVRRGGGLSYAMPDQLVAPAVAGGPELDRIVRDWVRSVDQAGNLVVIKTPPGSAHLVGFALDRADLADVVGTICGDDTMFVACRGAADATALTERLGSALR